ncbi:MAG: leucyl aminopeptidase family protein [Gammaproteobacteria bacterium]|nr:MAG: leucyl aminopeptidase family protein [Gammaproteobacteria bacterium]
MEALLAAVLTGAARLPDYKREPEPPVPLKEVVIWGAGPRDDFSPTQAAAEGNELARALTLLPANELGPAEYRERLKRLAASEGWKTGFMGEATLRRRGAGAFLAVTRGSARRDAGIVRLGYRPRHGGGPPLVLVGKGICHDTGGINLKPHRYMLGMHGDMQGSAVALGTLLALTRLKVDYPVDCWLALARNDIGPEAYRPDEVVKAADGTTIEVVHTDAEGRMVLADTLALASRTRPRLIIDFATLTGACVHALGEAYSGVFSNRQEWWPRLIEAGRESGERVWPFPMDEDYDEALRSEIADVKQCAEEGKADHILAARFLSRFVGEETPWVHVDLSSGTRKGGLAQVPTEVTGFGIRFALRLLERLEGELRGRD